MKDSIEQRLNIAFWALISAFFVNFLGYAFIVPILPSWQAQFDINATQATLLVSLWAVPMFLMGPLSGRITDRYGAGTTILASLILLTISSGIYLLATNEWLPHPFLALCFARLLHGASGATIMTAGLAAASQLWPTQFGEQAGKLLGIAAIGGLLGPVFGGVLFAWGEALAFGFLAATTLCVVPVVAYASRIIGRSQKPSLGTASIKVFFTDPVLLRVGILLAITTVATGALEAGVPLFLNDTLGLSSAEIGGVLLVMVLMQGLGSLIWGKLVDRNGPTRYMILGWSVVVISLIGVGCVGWIYTGTHAIIGMIILLGAFQFSIAAAQIPMIPIIDTATNQALGEGNPGLAFGAFGTAWAAGAILGPLLVGPVFDIFQSWALALGVLAIPASIALFITLRNREILHECYDLEMQRRLKS
ncbi:MAG: hypothetical protein CMA65_04760 [Euryarchaeota archaeon]|nr:hypothetical protein [Euryarchaeota archaeon]